MDNCFNFLKVLKDKGYKLTNQRKIILNVLCINEGKHLSCEEICNIINLNSSELGIATVYRTMIIMGKMNLVQRIDLNDGISRYEINRNIDFHKHHHLICEECEKIDEVDEDLLESLEEEIFKKKGFVIKDHKVNFYGICKECSKLN